MISMVEDEQLKLAAMVRFILEKGLIEMLTETDDSQRYTLNFEVNKECTFRTFVGPEQFKAVVKRTIEIIGDQDRETRIILLDKILETKLVLQTLIQLQWSQIE